MKPVVLRMQAFGPFAGEQVVDFRVLGERAFFLIHGPTGSGKTTILDGICFALFGDSSGGERDGRQMRSHHADAATLTEVSFEFALGERRYRVRRVPEQMRRAQRGGGETLQKPQAELWRIDADAAGRATEVPLASGASKVNAEVVGLLGFESAQFRQVIVLPQGRFRDFLVSGTAEREKILQTLFGTEIYKRIEEALRAAANEIQREADVAREQRKALLEVADAADDAALAARLQQQKDELAARTAADAAAAKAATAAEQGLTMARGVAARFVEFDAAAAALARLAAAQPDWESRRRQLAIARQAAQLRPVEAAMSNAQGELDGETARGRLLVAQLEVQRTAQQKADAALEQAKAKSPEVDRLVARVADLEKLADKVASLATVRSEHAAAGKAKAAAEQALKAAQAAQLAATDNVAKLAEEIQRLRLAVAGLDGLRARHGELARRVEQLRALAKLEADLAQSAKALAASQGARQQAEAAAAAALAAREATQRAWVAGQSVRLAAALVAGAPCPVCGSCEHPEPAHAAAEAESGQRVAAPGVPAPAVADETLAAAEQAAAGAQDALRRADAAVAEAQSRHSAVAARVESARKELGEAAAFAGDAKALARLADEASAAARSLAEAEAQAKSLQARAPLLAPAEEQAKQAAGAVANAGTAVADAERRLQELTGRLAEREQAVPADLAAPADLQAATTAARGALADLRASLDTAGRAAGKAAEDLAATTGKIATSNEVIARLTRQFAERRDEFARALTGAGFADADAYGAARLDEAAIVQLETAIREFDASLGEAGKRHARAADDTRELQRPDLAALEAAHAAAKALFLEAGKAVRDTLAARDSTAGFVASLEKLAAEYRDIEAKHAVLKQVANVACGTNAQQMSFQRYVLATLLEEVLAAATLRLRVMSRGRYEMRRRSVPTDRRAAAGLDLDVFDHYTGTARAAGTLSGGESFLAALALALGLSDVVQAYAGGIRLDAIFVDEGFGTLDPESLDFAVRALKDLQQAGRMVGIISHVAELKEWIDARLELTSGASGSSAQFRVA